MAGLFTISDLSSFETKIKRSRFIAHLSPASTTSEVKTFISQVSNEHSSASHNCWAYILGNQGDTEHASDQGEPPGTAGKPMLNVLIKHKLTNIVVVVTRYFGGTKLGIPGLIEAYSAVVDQALENTKIIPLRYLVTFILDTSYNHQDFIRHQLTEIGAEKIDSSYSEIVHISLEIEEEKSETVELFLEEMKKIDKINQWSKL